MPQGRLFALDLFRGLTIAAMILVNNPGSWSYVYAPLLHAKWHGWTPTDLIFPFFLFIVGISIVLSTQKPLQDGMPKTSMIKKASIRSMKLFLLGLFLAVFYYNFQDPNYSWWQNQIADIRIMGVLQRISLAFIVTYILALYLKKTGLWLAFLGLLGLYAGLMVYTTYSGPDGQSFQGLWEFGNSFAAYIDHQILGAGHNYYRTSNPFTFDPEGILSTIPAIATTLSGVLVGDFIQSNKFTLKDKTIRLVALGIIAVIIGYALNPITPINKALWTPAYVFVTSGIAMIFLGCCVVITDMLKYRLWAAPFIVFGANAIAFYMLSAMFARILIMVPIGNSSLKGAFYDQILAPTLGPVNGSLAFAIIFMVIGYWAMLAMYKRKIFWKV